MTIAHTFWHGTMTSYELASMKSMIANGFEVWFWSFNDYDVPDGVVRKDASLIAPVGLIHSITHAHWNEDWGVANESTAITLYSDLLRYRLLEKFGGWWFDLDIFCLRPSSDFDALALSAKICIGGQWPGEELCNNAVLSIPDVKIAKDINKLVDTTVQDKSSFFWGELGPALLSTYVKEEKLTDQVLPRTFFYPNSFAPNNENMWKYEHDLSASEASELESELSGAYTLHWYNNNLILSDKQASLPPETSIMGKLFKTVGV